MPQMRLTMSRTSSTGLPTTNFSKREGHDGHARVGHVAVVVEHDLEPGVALDARHGRDADRFGDVWRSHAVLLKMVHPKRDANAFFRKLFTCVAVSSTVPGIPWPGSRDVSSA
jgi:hypothetical protein